MVAKKQPGSVFSCVHALEMEEENMGGKESHKKEVL